MLATALFRLGVCFEMYVNRCVSVKGITKFEITSSEVSLTLINLYFCYQRSAVTKIPSQDLKMILLFLLEMVAKCVFEITLKRRQWKYFQLTQLIQRFIVTSGCRVKSSPS